MIDSSVIQSLREFEWADIIRKCNRLSDLNGAQWLFMKGLVTELIVEKHSWTPAGDGLTGHGLTYVGDAHRDYDWPRYGMSVELKSNMSSTMHRADGRLRKSYKIRLSNTRATNGKATPPDEHVADILIAVYRDGAFAVDRETVQMCSIWSGGGFDVNIPSECVQPLTSRPVAIEDTSCNYGLRDDIMALIRRKVGIEMDRATDIS